MKQENELNSITRQLEDARMNRESNISLNKAIESKTYELKKAESKYIEAQQEIADLNDKIEQKEQLIKDLLEDKELLRKEISEKYDDEKELKTKIEYQNAEIEKVKLDKQQAEKDLDKLLGHGNTNQKIKYMNDFRDKYNDLVEKNKDLDYENKRYLKLLEDNGLLNKLNTTIERYLIYQKWFR